jgi:hypothetical protein
MRAATLLRQVLTPIVAQVYRGQSVLEECRFWTGLECLQEWRADVRSRKTEKQSYIAIAQAASGPLGGLMKSPIPEHSCRMLRVDFLTSSLALRVQSAARRCADHQQKSSVFSRTSACLGKSTRRCSVNQSQKKHNFQPSNFRRAFLGGLLLTASAMPFTTSRRSRASAAEFTADKVQRRLNIPSQALQ